MATPSSMASPETHESGHAKRLFVAALDRPTTAREAYVRTECGADSGLAATVLRLLRAHDGAEGLKFMGSDGASDREVGTQLGPYRLERLLAEGGFGRVYLASQTTPFTRQVAVKVLKPGMDSKQVLARFEVERHALAMMDHPNIAQILDAGTTSEGRPYFVMEFVAGDPIVAYCDEHTLRIRERLEIFEQVCFAVHHAHQKGVIHRDLKPSNVLVAEREGEPLPKVIDFGIAKALSTPLTDRTLLTGARQMLGTPQYMSPEQAKIGEGDVDTRSDIYSLGVVLYELLTGTTPLTRGDLEQNRVDVRELIAHQAPVLPSQKMRELTGAALDDCAFNRRTDPLELRRTIRGDLDWIALKALERDRRRRYDSAADLARDLRRHLDHEPVLARRPGPGYLFWKLVRRHQVAATAIVSVTLALVVGFVLAMAGLKQADDQRNLATSQLRDLHLAQARAHRATNRPGRRFEALASIASAAAIRPGDDLRDEAIASMGLTDIEWLRAIPDMSGVLSRGGGDHDLIMCWRPDAGLELRKMSDGTLVRTYPDIRDQVYPSELSGDGRYAAMSLAGARAVVLDLTTGKRILELDPGRYRPNGIAFDRKERSPRWVAFALQGEQARVFALPSGEPLRTLPISSGKTALAGSPDGRFLATTSDAEDAVLAIHDLDGESPQLRISPPDGLNDLDWHPSGGSIAGACDDGNVYVWSTEDGELIRSFTGHQGVVTLVDFDATGEILASHSWDATLRLWNLRSGTAFIDPLIDHGLVEIDRDLITYRAGSLNVWRTENAPELRKAYSASRFGAPASLAISESGRWIATAANNGVRLWDSRSLRVVGQGIPGYARGAAFSAGDRFLVGSIDGELRRWTLVETRDGIELGDPIVLSTAELESGMALTADGRAVLLTDRENLHLVSVDSGETLGQWPGFEGAARPAVSPDGRFVFVGTWKGAPARVIEARSGDVIRTFDAIHVRGVFSPDNRWLCIATGESNQLYEVGSWRLVHDFPRGWPDDLAGSMAFSESGDLLALGHSRYETTLVSPDSGKVLARFTNPDQIATSDLSFDGSRQLCVLSPADTVLIWHVNRVRSRLEEMGLGWPDR